MVNANYVDKGIYALASSKGILNGKYIPDNIEWGTVDAPGLDPIENGVIQTAWRGVEDDPNPDSINYKFKKGMKQLSASIATTVYDLELTDNKGGIIDAPVVDNDNKIITFYVGLNEFYKSKATLVNPVVDEANETITYKYSNEIGRASCRERV